MPPERRKRVMRHEKAARLEKQDNATIDSHPETGPVAKISGSQMLASLSTPGQLKTQIKSNMRHEALLERLEASSTPCSKSHARRLQRKAKEELTTDLTSIGAAIAAMDTQHVSNFSHPPSDNKNAARETKLRPGQIGKGKAASLTKNQRKRTLQAEKLRHSLIMVDRDFAASPFSTLRVHAKNTLVQRQT